MTTEDTYIPIIAVLVIITITSFLFYYNKTHTYIPCSKSETYYYYMTGGGVAPGININTGDLAVTSIPKSKIYVQKEQASSIPNVETESKCIEGDYWIKK